MFKIVRKYVAPMFKTVNTSIFCIIVMLWLYHKQRASELNVIRSLEKLLENQHQKDSKVNEQESEIKTTYSIQFLKLIDTLQIQADLIKTLKRGIVVSKSSERQGDLTASVPVATLSPTEQLPRENEIANNQFSSSEKIINSSDIITVTHSFLTNTPVDIYVTAFVHIDRNVTGLVTVATSEILREGKHFWYNRCVPDRGKVVNNVYAQKIALDSVYFQAVEGGYQKVRIFSLVNTKRGFGQLGGDYARRFRKTLRKYLDSNIELEFRTFKPEGEEMIGLNEVYEEFKLSCEAGMYSMNKQI